MACEDYPCCGHESGDCPRLDSKGRERWTCVACGEILSFKAVSSICTRCLKRAARDEDSFGGDHNYSMNY